MTVLTIAFVESFWLASPSGPQAAFARSDHGIEAVSRQARARNPALTKDHCKHDLVQATVSPGLGILGPAHCEGLRGVRVHQQGMSGVRVGLVLTGHSHGMETWLCLLRV